MSFAAEGFGVDSVVLSDTLGRMFDTFTVEQHKPDMATPQININYNGPVIINASNTNGAKHMKRHPKEHRVNTNRYAARIPKTTKKGEPSKFPPPLTLS